MTDTNEDSGPLTADQWDELRAAIDHLSGPDAWDGDELEGHLIPVTHLVPRLMDAVRHVRSNAETLDLAPVRELLDGTSPGPWAWNRPRGLISALPAPGDSLGFEIVMDVSNIPGGLGDDEDPAVYLGACGHMAEARAGANLEFLAAARELVPALVAEVDRLRALVWLLGASE